MAPGSSVVPGRRPTPGGGRLVSARKAALRRRFPKSPLPDSNRRPLPYHGRPGVQRAHSRGHGKSRFAGKTWASAQPPVPAIEPEFDAVGRGVDALPARSAAFRPLRNCRVSSARLHWMLRTVGLGLVIATAVVLWWV